MTEETVYHIYAKDKVLYHNLIEEDFEEKWELLNVMVGLIKSDYTEEDLSYIRLEASDGHESGWGEPDGSPSF